VITLERNYRSTQPILEAANAVAAQASRAFPKHLHCELKAGSQPELIFCRDESAQAAEVCDRCWRPANAACNCVNRRC
jgi:DNA helicase-2/ATP-dependent DNA helicase PcrA